jgi:hypothetical protein
MSVWTEVAGVIYLQNGCGFSVRRYLEDNFDGVIVRGIEQNSVGSFTSVKVKFVFCDSNLPAAKVMQAFVDKVVALDKRNTADLIASLRFIS